MQRIWLCYVFNPVSMQLLLVPSKVFSIKSFIKYKCHGVYVVMVISAVMHQKGF